MWRYGVEVVFLKLLSCVCYDVIIHFISNTYSSIGYWVMNLICCKRVQTAKIFNLDPWSIGDPYFKIYLLFLTHDSPKHVQSWKIKLLSKRFTLNIYTISYFKVQKVYLVAYHRILKTEWHILMLLHRALAHSITIKTHNNEEFLFLQKLSSYLKCLPKVHFINRANSDALLRSCDQQKWVDQKTYFILKPDHVAVSTLVIYHCWLLMFQN